MINLEQSFINEAFLKYYKHGSLKAKLKFSILFKPLTTMEEHQNKEKKTNHHDYGTRVVPK